MATLTSFNQLGGVIGDDFEGLVIISVIADGEYIWEPQDLAGSGGGATNLSIGTVDAANVTVNSDTGTNATLPTATTTTAGVMPAADKTKSDFITVTQAVDLDAIEQDVADYLAITGVADGAQDLGTFTGSTIPDNSQIKPAFQALETALEAIPTRVQDVVADITARDALTGNQTGDLIFVVDASADATVTSGGALYIRNAANTGWEKVAEGESLDVATDLAAGTVNGTTYEITSSTGANHTIAAATNTTAGVMPAATFDEHGDLITLSGVAAGDVNLGTFTGTTIPDNQTNKQAFQALETAVENRLEGEIYENLAALPSPTGLTVGFIGVVVNDATASNNGTYTVAGATVGANGLAWIRG